MAIADDLEVEVGRIFRESWNVRDGRVVPEDADLSLGNEAVEFKQATVLYADLSGSTALVDDKSWQFAAEIYRSFLYCAARIIRNEGGVVTAYDGDRVMGVFIGETQSTDAVRAALKIRYAVSQIINPAIKKQYSKSSYVVRHVVGVDMSHISVARTGVRGGNDLVWVGRAANYAAKLTELDLEPRTWITKDVFDSMTDSVKYGGNPKQLMWKSWTWTPMNGYSVYSSTWHWKV
jgi:class 3 adenylate cyclase